MSPLVMRMSLALMVEMTPLLKEVGTNGKGSGLESTTF